MFYGKQISNWFSQRGYKNNIISRCMKEFGLTENQMAQFLGLELLQIRLFLRYDDEDLYTDMRNLLEFIYFLRFDHSIKPNEKVSEYIAYKKGLVDPPF